ncbi:hypothetical protein [Corynebacterium rouxii]|uniref:Uncharacterized protein n=1 Tax=Corynebacterium rouxii TaxID=2719119 RepID=A0A6I8ME89_9CORY|nr:hypothetical protein [Corynebacterium rouxii]VZH86418.1 hypothetical protein FRC0190_02328 [Corynebacterium rouxii]
MTQVFRNRFREVWISESGKQTALKEKRRYFLDPKKFENEKDRLFSDVPFYKVGIMDNYFFISDEIKVNLWEFIIKNFRSDQVSELDFFLSERIEQLGKYIGNMPYFRSEINRRLPRDIDELRIALDIELVAKFFRNSGISTVSMKNMIHLMETDIEQSSSLVHGCLRLRNLGLTVDDRLVIIFGDDVVFGSILVTTSSLIADLYDLKVIYQRWDFDPFTFVLNRFSISLNEEHIKKLKVFVFFICCSACSSVHS